MGTDSNSTLQHAVALAPRRYLGTDQFRWDQQQIVGAHWQVVAPGTACAQPGDVLARHVAGVPVAVVRSEQGLRGYLNICAHRAGPVVPCDSRANQILRCGYHGWTYSLDGQLLQAPKMRQAKNFAVSDVHLQPIDVHEWGGLIWARLGGDVPFADWIAGIEDYVEGRALGSMTHRLSRVYDVAANWKIYVDNFLEGYHLPFVHPELTQVVDFPNYTTELGRYWSVQRSPVPEDSGAYGAGEAYYFFIYPNTMLNVMPGRLQTNRVVPIDADRCRVEFDFYYAPDQVHRWQEDLRFSEQVQEEDRVICEHVHAAFESGRYDPGRLSPEREAGVHHWHELLREAYAQSEGVDR